MLVGLKGRLWLLGAYLYSWSVLVQFIIYRYFVQNSQSFLVISLISGCIANPRYKQVLVRQSRLICVIHPLFSFVYICVAIYSKEINSHLNFYGKQVLNMPSITVLRGTHQNLSSAEIESQFGYIATKVRDLPLIYPIEIFYCKQVRKQENIVLLITRNFCNFFSNRPI